MGSSIHVKRLTRHFARTDRPAVDALDLNVEPGEVMCLVGPSGCGKSTTLRMIAGLELPDSGSIVLDGADITALPPQERDVAMVFQGFALYPHLSARQIMEFPLKMRRVPAAERAKQVGEAAELLGIGGLLERLPGELSGGERQRVAMGRAIVRRPKLFLFDEPLSNLDAALRAELRSELGRLLRTLKTTALYVTHDQTEAMTLGHRICVLREGKLEQLGTPRQIYEQPSSEFVASFFGSPPMNLFVARREAEAFKAGGLQVPLSASPQLSQRDDVTIGIRPEHLHLSFGATSDTLSVTATGVVTEVEPLGAVAHLTVDLEGVQLRCMAEGFDVPQVSSQVQLSCSVEDVAYFDPSTGARL